MQRNKLVERLNAAYQSDTSTTFSIDNGSYTYKDLADAVFQGTEVGLNFAKTQIEAWEEFRQDETKYTDYTFVEWLDKNLKAEHAIEERPRQLLSKAITRATMSQFNPDVEDLTVAETQKAHTIYSAIYDNDTGSVGMVNKIFELWDREEKLEDILADKDKAFALTLDNDFLRKILGAVEIIQEPEHKIEITPQQRLKFANSFRNVKNPDETMVFYAGRSLSSNMIADAIEKDTDLGRDHIRMLCDLQVCHYEGNFGQFLDEDIDAESVRPEQRKKIAAYFNALAQKNNDEECFIFDGFKASQVAEHILANDAAAQKYLDIIIEDWGDPDEEEIEEPLTFNEYLNKEYS
ncbi:MAG: hypothetical protein ACT4OY_04915 [Alphaproteobacteria bacterium]